MAFDPLIFASVLSGGAQGYLTGKMQAQARSDELAKQALAQGNFDRQFSQQQAFHSDEIEQQQAQRDFAAQQQEAQQQFQAAQTQGQYENQAGLLTREQGYNTLRDWAQNRQQMQLAGYQALPGMIAGYSRVGDIPTAQGQRSTIGQYNAMLDAYGLPNVPRFAQLSPGAKLQQTPETRLTEQQIRASQAGVAGQQAAQQLDTQKFGLQKQQFGLDIQKFNSDVAYRNAQLAADAAQRRQIAAMEGQKVAQGWASLNADVYKTLSAAHSGNLNPQVMINLRTQANQLAKEVENAQKRADEAHTGSNGWLSIEADAAGLKGDAENDPDYEKKRRLLQLSETQKSAQTYWEQKAADAQTKLDAAQGELEKYEGGAAGGKSFDLPQLNNRGSFYNQDTGTLNFGAVIGKKVGPLACATTATQMLRAAGVPIPSESSAGKLEEMVQGSKNWQRVDPSKATQLDLLFWPGEGPSGRHVEVADGQGGTVGAPGSRTDYRIARRTNIPGGAVAYRYIGPQVQEKQAQQGQPRNQKGQYAPYPAAEPPGVLKNSLGPSIPLPPVPPGVKRGGPFGGRRDRVGMYSPNWQSDGEVQFRRIG